jgi:hypothetical protein
MGVLNRTKSGGSSAANGTDFFSTVEASQLNTLLRGAGGGADTSADEGGSGAGEALSENIQARADSAHRDPSTPTPARKSLPARTFKGGLHAFQTFGFVLGEERRDKECVRIVGKKQKNVA